MAQLTMLSINLSSCQSDLGSGF